jgi:hypothetical protein
MVASSVYYGMSILWPQEVAYLFGGSAVRQGFLDVRTLKFRSLSVTVTNRPLSVRSRNRHRRRPGNRRDNGPLYQANSLHSHSLYSNSHCFRRGYGVSWSGRISERRRTAVRNLFRFWHYRDCFSLFGTIELPARRPGARTGNAGIHP